MTRYTFKKPIKTQPDIEGDFGHALTIEFDETATRVEITNCLNKLIKHLNDSIYYKENEKKLSVDCFNTWFEGEKKYDMLIQSPPIDKLITLKQALRNYCDQLSDNLITSLEYDDGWYDAYHHIQFKNHISLVK